jgi:hypothetical protein
VNPYNIGPQDYFGHRQVSSPLARERSSAYSEHTAIPRKPVGSPICRRNNQSSNTIIHSGSIANSVRNEDFLGDSPQPPTQNDYPRVEMTLDTQPLVESFLDSISRSQKLDSFLESILPVKPGDQHESEATAISYRSVSMTQAHILQLSDQTPKGTGLEKRYTSLKELPPVNLKDPFMARMPLSSHPIGLPSIWAAPTIPASPERPASHIAIPTTTTTGYDHLQPRLVQFDGQNEDASDAQARRPSLQRKTTQIPLRTSSHQNSKQHVLQSRGSQTNPADIATSSEHLLGQTKQRTVRLCHTISPGGERVVMKNTPISMSTSPQTPDQPGKVSPAAHTAALTAFQNLRHRAPMKNTVDQDREDSLTPPKLRRPKKEMRDISLTAKRVLGGQGDIGDLSRTRVEVEADSNLYQRRLTAAARAGAPNDGSEDGLVVLHPSPNAENRKSMVVAGSGPVVELMCLPRKGAASPARKPIVEERGEIMSLITTHHNRGLSPIRVGSPQRRIRSASGITGQVSPSHHCNPRSQELTFPPKAVGPLVIPPISYSKQT